MTVAEQNRGIAAVTARDRTVWRAWLKEHHAAAKNVWLIIHRTKSGVPSVQYAAAVEEALCFGWIDSTPNKRDEKSFYLYFAKRSPRSKWSALNKRRVEKLTKQRKMAPAGRAMVELAKRTGTWTALEASDRMVVPKDLAAAFRRIPGARKYFLAFPPSRKKAILEWINSAKQPATRERRVTETAVLAAKNIRANEWRPKNGARV